MQAAAFPSVTWFEGLAGAMARRHDGCEALGPLELTLVVRVLYPERTIIEQKTISIFCDGERG